LKIDADSLPQQVMHAVCLARAGKHTEAIAKAEPLRAKVAKDPDLLVRLAGVYAVCGNAASGETQKRQQLDLSLEILRGGVDPGYRDAEHLRTPPARTPLAEERALKQLGAKVAAQNGNR